MPGGRGLLDPLLFDLLYLDNRPSHAGNVCAGAREGGGVGAAEQCSSPDRMIEN